MLQRPKYRVSRANVFASRPRGATSAHIATSCSRELYCSHEYNSSQITLRDAYRCMLGRIILSEYMYMWRRDASYSPDTSMTGRCGNLNFLHFILQDYTRVKLWEIFTIPQLAPLRRIVKLLCALTPPKMCLLTSDRAANDEDRGFVPPLVKIKLCELENLIQEKLPNVGCAGYA